MQKRKSSSPCQILLMTMIVTTISFKHGKRTRKRTNNNSSKRTKGIDKVKKGRRVSNQTKKKRQRKRRKSKLCHAPMLMIQTTKYRRKKSSMNRKWRRTKMTEIAMKKRQKVVQTTPFKSYTAQVSS